MGASSTVSVSFVVPGASGDGLVVVEPDEEKHAEIYGDSKSEWFFGDRYYFRVYRDPMPDGGTTFETTDGVVHADGEGVADLVEQISFEDAQKATVQKPIKDGRIIDRFWFGNDLGVVAGDGRNRIVTSRKGYGICELEYQSEYQRFYLVLDGRGKDREWPVNVYIF
jgi:hypothetical protein